MQGEKSTHTQKEREVKLHFSPTDHCYCFLVRFGPCGSVVDSKTINYLFLEHTQTQHAELERERRTRGGGPSGQAIDIDVTDAELERETGPRGRAIRPSHRHRCSPPSVH